MESVVERINRYKQEFFRTYNFDKKSNLCNLIYLLEDYTGIYDQDFHKSVENDRRRQEIMNHKRTVLSNRLKVFARNNNDLIENIIEPFKIECVSSKSYQEQYINPNVCLKIVCDFLLSVDPYLYNVFCELYQDNRVLVSNRIHNGCEINVKRRDTIHIFSNSLCKVSDMATLVHEMGHAYKDYLIPEYHEAYDIDDILHSEISSMSLELMFIMYLINNRIYYDDAFKYFNFYENRIYQASKCYSKETNLNIDKFRDLSYLLGSICANNYVLEPNMSYDDFIRKIYFSNIRTILKEYSKNNKVKKFHF